MMMSEETQQTPERWKPLSTPGFMEMIGPLLRPVAPERPGTFGLATDSRHANHIGIVHGGVIASLLDQAIAIVAWNAAERRPTVTVQMDVRFLGAAKVGDFLTVTVASRHAAGSLMFLDAEMSAKAGPVANASAIMKVSKMRGSSA